MPLDKDKVGSRYKCFKCGVKFYDLKRDVATCPECGADQADAPVQDIKALMARGKRPTGDADRDEFDDEGEAEGGEEDEDGLFNDDDDDDGGSDDDEEEIAEGEEEDDY